MHLMENRAFDEYNLTFIQKKKKQTHLYSVAKLFKCIPILNRELIHSAYDEISPSLSWVI